MFDYLPKLVYDEDEPLAIVVCFPLYYVSKLIRDNASLWLKLAKAATNSLRVRYLSHQLAFAQNCSRYYSFWPQWIKKVFYKLNVRLGWLKNKPLLLEYLRRTSENEFLFWGGAHWITEYDKGDLLSESFRKRTKSSYWMVDQYLKQLAKFNPQADYLQKMTYLEFKHRLPELLLMRVDKVSMSTSIEARAPFLDHRFVEQMAGLPSKLKVQAGQAKYMLKKAAEGLFRDNIIYRPKKGFGAPISQWMKDEQINRRMEAMVMDSDLMKPTTSIESILPTSSHVNAIRSTPWIMPLNYGCSSIWRCGTTRTLDGKMSTKQVPRNCQNGSDII